MKVAVIVFIAMAMFATVTGDACVA